MITTNIGYYLLYLLKAAIVFGCAFGLEKGKLNIVLKTGIVIIFNIVLFFIFSFNIWQILSYMISMSILNFVAEMLRKPQRTQSDNDILKALIFFSLTIIDFDIIFITINTFKIAQFGLTQVLVVIMFIVNVLPKFLKIWGNFTQIRITNKLFYQEWESKGKNTRTWIFKFWLLVRIISNVFLTDRSKMIQDRKISKIESDTADILEILRQQYPDLYKNVQDAKKIKPKAQKKGAVTQGNEQETPLEPVKSDELKKNE